MQGQFENNSQEIKFEVPLPEEGGCFDYLFECKGKGKGRPMVGASSSYYFA